MSKIMDAVAGVIVCKDEVFVIKRQNNLKAFPGYWSFPGGKVDPDDSKYQPSHPLFKITENHLIGALCREVKEELNLSLEHEVKTNNLISIDLLGLAVTPDFNPMRFSTYFFKITLKEKIPFIVDGYEAESSFWLKSSHLLEQFNKGEVLAVPPTIKVIKSLGENIHTSQIKDLNFEMPKDLVPWIESMAGVVQVMPLSNTLPPATRTNAFIIGDTDKQVFLIDPSPKSVEEKDKFLKTLKAWRIDQIFLTHHHPDHHEYSVEISESLNVPMVMSQFTYDRLKEKQGSHYFKNQTIRIVKEGDVLTTWQGQRLFVIEVPGHDKGQLALMPENKNWFLAGDLFQGVGTVVIGGEGSSMKEYMETLRKVIDLKPQVVFPSHGIGLGGTLILEKTLEHRNVRESQVLDLFLKNKTEEEMLQYLYAEISSSLKPYALCNIRSHLQKLKEEGKIN